MTHAVGYVTQPAFSNIMKMEQTMAQQTHNEKKEKKGDSMNKRHEI